MHSGVPDFACAVLDATTSKNYVDFLTDMSLTRSSLMKSPIVEVIVGSGANKTTYSAHEAVLVKSPEFTKQEEQFAPGGVRPFSLPSQYPQNPKTQLIPPSLARSPSQTSTSTPWAQ